MPYFFVPTPGDLTAEESLPPGICHSRQKNGNARAGGQPKGGGGGWAPVELTALMLSGSTPAEGTIFLFFFLVVLLLFS